MPTVYWLLRAFLRIRFAVSGRKVRLLHAEGVAASSPTMFVVSRPPGFLDALLVVAAFDAPVRCLLPRRHFQGRWQKFLASGLGMIPYEPDGEGWRSALDASSNLLAKRGTVAVFAEARRKSTAEGGQLGLAAAILSLEAEARHAAKLGLRLLPVHVYLPAEGSKTKEALVYVDEAVFPQEYLSKEGGTSPGGVLALATLIERKWRENAFRIQPSTLKHFLSDLEEVLRADLAESWVSRANLKQSVEGFELSHFVADWADRMNALNPGGLVSMREALEDYRENLRNCRLREFEVETGSGWIKSWLRRSSVWFETIVGLPIASYGLVNHLLAWMFLYWAGLLRKDSRRSLRVDWLLRALVVLGCYAVQTFVCFTWFGSQATTVYAATLPVAGGYLWRYHWLLRRRTRLVIAALRRPGRAQKLREKRKELLGGLQEELSAFADVLGVSH